MTKVERLAERLKAEFDFGDAEPQYQRIYSSPAMRASGCWSWFVIQKGERRDHDGIVRRRDVGSTWNVTQLLAAPEWSIIFDRSGDCWQIDPADG